MVAKPIADISSDFGKVRNTSPEFLDGVAALDADVQAVAEVAESAAVKDFARQMNKLLKRIDNGAVLSTGCFRAC